MPGIPQQIEQIHLYFHHCYACHARRPVAYLAEHRVFGSQSA